MKTYLLFSDVVLMGLISSFTTLAVLILTAVINARMKRVEKQQADSLKQMDGHMTTLLQTTAELNNKIGRDERKAEQAPIIEQQIKQAEELGVLKGKEEIRIEIKNGDHPIETIVVENKDKEVIIKKNLDK